MNANKLLGTLLLVLAVTLTAVAKAPKNTTGVGESRNITFASAVKVGNTLLPVGNYRMEHVMEGENHVMVFQSLSNAEATARVNCQIVPLQKKASESTQEYNSQNGEEVLKAITFRGDMYKHQF